MQPFSEATAQLPTCDPKAFHEAHITSHMLFMNFCTKIPTKDIRAVFLAVVMMTMFLQQIVLIDDLFA